MPQRNHYYLGIDDLAQARGPIESLRYEGAGPNDFAAALTEAMRSPQLFEHWRALQEEPDEVDPALGVTDAAAEARATVDDMQRVDVDLVTSLPMSVVRHRLNLLIGKHWSLRDMRAA